LIRYLLSEQEGKNSQPLAQNSLGALAVADPCKIYTMHSHLKCTVENISRQKMVATAIKKV